ncbi:replication-relaxation family protein [Erythrobacter sp.]|uniref:replication-relaxation family protein n=1 Tax=Erythrobacter sp. TaxID=1042 RepID=UPI001B186A2A|nr:replication-relaxation family protein [Erythrobacter sp.]MBO6527848.1 replication-relaxation family protein [Erythrobacter sp.]MBO6530285.1 replication-relaxation family protein [Erythrobacter sp.]
MLERQHGGSRRNRLEPTPTGKRVSPQERDLLWFVKLADHGPMPTSFLLEFSRHIHKSEKRAKERLADLFNEDNTPHQGPYLTRPPQQFQTIDSRYQQLVHDIGQTALSALKEQGLSAHPKQSGPWLHSFMVSCITASVELACRQRDDLNYIPQGAIIARANTILRWPTEISDPNSGSTYTKDLLPDAVFGLEHQTDSGSRFRFFAVEADRATEPASSSNFHRKSFERHLLQYTEYIEHGGYSEHLNLTAPMLVLNVTSDSRRMEKMISLTQERFPAGNSYQLFAKWDAFATPFKPPKPNFSLLRSPWARAGLAPFELQSYRGQ